MCGWALWGAAACGHKPVATTAVPAVTLPLPTAALAGQQVIVLPLTLVAAEDSLHWDAVLGDRRATLARADSLVGAALKERAPEVSWILPDELRRAARRAPGLATDPGQMATAMLRARNLSVVPDPLRAQLRTLAALAGAAAYALVPAALVYRRSPTGTSGGAATAALAELTIVVADVRTGHVGWRTTARGEGSDPWNTLARAMKALTPGLP
jgi:hypothetical protein